MAGDGESAFGEDRLGLGFRRSFDGFREFMKSGLGLRAQGFEFVLVF